MEILVIKNEIKLVNSYSEIQVNVIVPTKNIQSMLEATKGRLISKKIITLPYHHRAGEVHDIVISAIFENVKDFLYSADFHEYGSCENFKSFTDLIHVQGRMYYTPGLKGFKDQIRGLYTFGDCSHYTHTETDFYYYSSGKPIQLNRNERTDYGRTRYVKNAGKWVSNRKF